MSLFDPGNKPTIYAGLLDALPMRLASGGVGRFAEHGAPHQRDFHAVVGPACLRAVGYDVPSEYRWILDERHRSAAKTWDVIAQVLLAGTVAPTRGRAVILSVDKEAAGVAMQLGLEILQLAPSLAERWRADRWKFTCLANDFEVQTMSSDSASFYGQVVDILCLDEWAHWLPGQEALWTAAISTMAKRQHSCLMIVGNSGWTDSWQFRVREELRQLPYVWFRSMTDFAPWVTQEHLDGQKRLLCDSDFRRLWRNEWVVGTQGGLDRGDIESAITLPGPTTWKLPNFGFIMGLDVGLSRDHSSLAVLGVDYARGRVRLADVFDWRPPPGGGKVSFADIKRTINEIRTRFCSPALFFDPWQAEALVEDLRREGLHCEPCMSSGAAATERTVALCEAVADRRLDLYDSTPAAELLLHDLRRCSIIDKVTGKKIESPRDEHGHGDRLTSFTLPLGTAMRAATAPRRETGPPTAMVHGVQVPLRDGMSILALNELAERFEDRLEDIYGW